MKPIAAAIAEIKRQFPPQVEPGALQVVAGLIVVALLLGAFFWVLESLLPEDRTQLRWRAASRTDLLYWFFDAFVDRRLVGIGVFLVVLVLVLLQVRRANTLVGHQPLGLQAIEALLLGCWAISSATGSIVQCTGYRPYSDCTLCITVPQNSTGPPLLASIRSKA
jgi:hypothetical protein